MANQFPYAVTRPYGVYDPAYANYPGSLHPGTDYGTGANTPLPAKMSGTVTVIDRGTAKTGRGREVVITNGNTQIKYCHLNRIDVVNGSQISVGQQIGLSGYTGYVVDSAGNVGTPGGAHLHFEVLINGVYTNPETWTGVTMEPTKTELGHARVMAYHIAGRNGYDGRTNALAGESDAELNKNHVGQPLSADLWAWYTSDEGKNFREKILPQVYADREMYKKNLTEVTADRDGLIVKLDAANARIKELEANQGGGGFTEEDRKKLTENNSIIKQIWEKITGVFK